jgi:putative flippase GtrA
VEPFPKATFRGTTVSKLVTLVYVMAAPTLAGVIVTALLTVGMTGRYQILAGAIAGFVVAIPVAFIVGKQIANRTRA